MTEEEFYLSDSQEDRVFLVKKTKKHCIRVFKQSDKVYRICFEEQINGDVSENRDKNC